MSGSNQEQQEQAPQQAQDQLQHLILQLLPQDHSFIGNITLLQQLTAAAGAPPSEEAFKAAREALVAAGHAVKGKGRGGSTARAADATRAATMARPDFELQAVAVTPDMLAATPAPKPRQPKASAPAASGEPQVISYRHPDRRKNNPEVGLVNEASDPEQPKTTYAYDPHLDPALQFDSARARAEQLIDDALAGNDPVAMRHALEELRRRSNPYLQWTGKAERTSFDIDTVSLHVHERIDAMSILSAVSKRQGKKGDKAGKAATGGIQPGLFEAPFESLPLRSAVDFYKHDRGWANRLVAGDSLLVMNSLLQKESMAGQVQMIYIDPPYGIKYGSNFQPFTNKRDVKDRSDADLTQEPEMIKAFRDTWELGIHSYLTYLRDRLLLAKELLSESGSVFVQISDENLHRVRIVLDEIFGSENFVSLITYSTTGGFATSTLSRTGDYIIWYAKNISKVKFSRLYIKKSQADAVLDDYDQLEQLSGLRRPLTQAEKRSPEKLHELGRCFTDDNPTSQGEGAATGDFKLAGLTFHPGDGNHWKAPLPHGMRRISRSKRLIITPKNKLRYLRYFSDFDQKPVTNAWFDIAGAVQDRADPKVYVVQTSNKIIERCLLLTTDPGDLVLDPTCGSGTTAYVAEKWGRRWITCDTSRVAITLAKQRLMTASFDYFELRYQHEGLKGGFIYKTVPHVTLKSIANNPEIDAIYERMHPGIDAALRALNQALASQPPAEPFPVTDGARKGQKLLLGRKGQELQEWEVPFDYPADWPAPCRDAFDAFHTARQAMQRQMDASIASHADNETLYDQPAVAKDKLRITGPFTVEAVPFPTVLSLEEQSVQAPSALAGC